MVPLILGNPHFMASLSFHGLAALGMDVVLWLAAAPAISNVSEMVEFQMLVFKLGGFFCLEIA